MWVFQESTDSSDYVCYRKKKKRDISAWKLLRFFYGCDVFVPLFGVKYDSDFYQVNWVEYEKSFITSGPEGITTVHMMSTDIQQDITQKVQQCKETVSPDT